MCSGKTLETLSQGGLRWRWCGKAAVLWTHSLSNFTLLSLGIASMGRVASKALSRCSPFLSAVQWHWPEVFYELFLPWGGLLTFLSVPIPCRSQGQERAGREKSGGMECLLSATFSGFFSTSTEFQAVYETGGMPLCQPLFSRTSKHLTPE